MSINIDRIPISLKVWVSTFGYRTPDSKDRFCPSEYEVPTLRVAGIRPDRVSEFVLAAIAEEKKKIEAQGAKRDLYYFEPTCGCLVDCITKDDLPLLDESALQRLIERDMDAILVLPNKGKLTNQFSDSYRDPYPR